MGISGGPDMIQNGLVLALDATDRNSYVSGSTTWLDISGNANNGTLVSGSTFNSANGGSIVFEGTSSYAEVANNTSLNSTTGTLSLWFNYTSAPGNGSVIIGKTNTPSSFNGYNIFIFQGTIAGQIKGSTSLIVTNLTGSAVSTNTWYNFSLSYSSGNTYTTYLNGTALGSGSLVSFNMSTQPLRMARSLDAYWTYFAGSISAVRLYNRELSATEIQQNYEAQKSRFGL